MQVKAIVWSSLIAASAILVTAAPARADVVAAYIEGHGGLASNNNETSATGGGSAASGSGLTPGLGFQIGARVLIFEGYFDRTAFGSGVSVSRGILGLRGGFGTDDLRLVLRGGGGVIDEQGGALSGGRTTLGVAERSGLVARAGVALEKRLAPGKLLGGLALDGEVFSLAGTTPATSGLADRTQGSDIFLSLDLKFELGI